MQSRLRISQPSLGDLQHEGTNKEQFEKIKQAARELSCDKDQSALKETLMKLVSALPPESVEKRMAKKGA